MEKLRQKREERRQEIERKRETLSLDHEQEFQNMIHAYRRDAATVNLPAGEFVSSDSRLRVFVRKRPLLPQEITAGEFDVLTLHGPRTVLHETRRRVDMQRVLENHDFQFDASFDVCDENEHIYASVARPLLDAVFCGGRATCFAYGQTGSGKTRTMMGDPSVRGLYGLAADECFERLKEDKDISVYVSMFEIYREAAFDLLASFEREGEPRKLQVLEDAVGAVRLVGLLERKVEGPEELLALLGSAQRARRTGSNAINERSSRSHALMQLQLRKADGSFFGMFTFVDLAGSERAADTLDDNRHTRNEGADINRSLLCLKECIRAMDEGSSHVPFRGSKLTHILRDSFTAEASFTSMIAHVSPASRAYDYSINTLRYAERLKTAASRRSDAQHVPLVPSAAQPVVAQQKSREKSNSSESSPAKIELASDALDQILDCLFDPDAWAAEKKVLRQSSDSLVGLRSYAERVDGLLEERISLYSELRGKLSRWRDKLTEE